jgi:predicted porin
MKVNRVLILAGVLMAAAAFTAGAADAPAAPALGQPGSLVEVYGIIDSAVRWSTHSATPSGGDYFGFSQGLFNGSRFGIRGTESLGESFKAVYDLEGGVILPLGGLDQQGQVFGRQSWVGVSSDFGKLAFGRQYGTFSDAVGVGDVFGINHGNMGFNSGKNENAPDAPNTFFLQEMGFRWDNSVKYDANFGGVSVGLMAALGDVAGQMLENGMYAASLGYASKDFPVAAAAAAQIEQDVVGRYHYNLGAGVKYGLGSTLGVYASYERSLFDQGFVRINANNSELSGSALPRSDDIASLGANYYVTPSLNVILADWFDYAQNVQASGDNGIRNSIIGALDFYVSKDFDLYLAGWYSMFSGALIGTLNGGVNAITDATAGGGSPVAAAGSFDSSISVMMGARYRF